MAMSILGIQNLQFLNSRNNLIVVELFKGQWQQKFLLPNFKVLLNLTTNMRLISHQTFLFRSYLHVISCVTSISSAILAHLLKKLSLGSHDPSDVNGRVNAKQQNTFVSD